MIFKCGNYSIYIGNNFGLIFNKLISEMPIFINSSR